MRPALIFIFLALSACEKMGGGGLGVVDNRTFLNALDGPKIPTVADAQMDAAATAEKQGDFKTAAQTYRQILEKKPENKEAALLLADAQRRMGENDQAIALYDSLLQKDAGNLGAKEGKGLALMAKGDFDAPGPLFEEVLKADPKRWKTLNGLGILFTTRNMHSEAQQYFQEALKQSPANITILNNLGLSQALDRNFPSATGTLLQASALAANGSPERKRVDLNLALVYAISGKVEDANAIASQYFTGAALNNNMGLYAHLAKDDGLAKAYLNMALSQSKTFYEKAWDNLQALDSATANSGPAKTDLPKISRPAPEMSKPGKKSKTAIDDQIIGIINDDGEGTHDGVAASPIP